MDRRSFQLLGAAFMAATVAGAPLGASAQSYPSQDIHVICAFPAGSGADVLVRYFAEKLREKAGKAVIVENKVGAAGNIAAEYTARAKPDGYTIHIHAGSSTAANYWLFKKPPIDPSKDLQVVATLNKQPFMVVVAANSPYKKLSDLTEAMLKKGDKASYAESNTTGKVMGELYKQATGVKAVDVPYRTANDSLNDFASGVIDYGMMDPVFALVQERAGRLRSLAVSSPARMGAVPNLPTMSESGVKGVELFGWFAAMVPSATPRPIVDQLNKWLNEIEATPETKAYLNKFGGDPWISTPEQGQAQLVKDQKAWEGYVKAAGIQPQG
ncbi:MAG TPA: tripartite tricarboxylate transporter substrate binding protein [Xanthobacteraceae bacterium]|nr:tripartite tricarboxylate transporter substrate binding protein [Xanthobacteraceae bacterium]